MWQRAGRESAVPSTIKMTGEIGIWTSDFLRVTDASSDLTTVGHQNEGTGQTRTKQQEQEHADVDERKVG